MITAITAQNTRRVAAVEAVSPKMIAAQIDAVFEDLPVRAVKIGMLGDPATICCVAEGLTGRDVPVVLDPVMIAKSGDRLLAAEAIATLKAELLPLATLLTPNLPEAATLLSESDASDLNELTRQGHDLLAMGPQWVLMKGGHAKGPICTDVLLGPTPLQLTAPRIATQNTHGTGCTLSAAIAAGLAQGMDVPTATTRAHRYLQGAIAASDALKVGAGHGPVHHFHALWKATA